MKNEKLRTTKIIKVNSESSDITSIWFIDKLVQQAKPGQYVMVWIPNVDEIPMSISRINKNGQSSISVKVVGEATEALVCLRQGDRIGIRGPFGNGFIVKGKKQLIVAGGSGSASILPLVEEMVSKNYNPTFVLGARKADMLIFVEPLKVLLKENLVITTDDGSLGYTGYASGYAAILMNEQKFDQVYTCGPEIMMSKVFHAAEYHGIPTQASLERYVKCAIGLCGSCLIGPYRICKDGPVLNSDMLRKIKDEFGIKRLDANGKYIKITH